MPLILRLLVALILLYRRFLSGRLTNVRCSFTAEESCSTFGLRIARAARTAREAIGRIARRLRRCGDACLIADGKLLGWSELHDRSPSDIVECMRADGENDASIWRMLQTRLAVARWCDDRPAFDATRTLLTALEHRSPYERPRVVSIGVVGDATLRRYRFAHRVPLLDASHRAGGRPAPVRGC